MLLDRVSGRRFASFVDHAHSARGWLKHFLIVALLAGLGALSALAYASVPDPVGLPGVYDDADHDDVVGLLTDTVGLGTSQLMSVHPVHFLLGAASFQLASAPRDVLLLSFHLRSPPAR